MQYAIIDGKPVRADNAPSRDSDLPNLARCAYCGELYAALGGGQ